MTRSGLPSRSRSAAATASGCEPVAEKTIAKVAEARGGAKERAGAQLRRVVVDNVLSPVTVQIGDDHGARSGPFQEPAVIKGPIAPAEQFSDTAGQARTDGILVAIAVQVGHGQRRGRATRREARRLAKGPVGPAEQDAPTSCDDPLPVTISRWPSSSRSAMSKLRGAGPVG